ncbi:aminoacyl tRNA synthase complex-interacting multifunctional protein 2-like [Argiope bruennichi]|uniref:aminoacyl tRNA synthase complex-interacting multifunctional protein 2-like n=1 Tax=Argiope bruennichi TaxID=94029 RepID=UPI002494E3BD|nr:aminoacyl tRNA synthase complex-interacting multifunctional protein 2-like [Argiope bruennichi]
MTANGPLMYHVRPLYDFTSNIVLPTCMYKMNNLHDSKFSTEFSHEVSSKSLDLAELEKSQLNIIHKLEDLKEKVLKLKAEFGVTSDNNLGKFQDIVVKANPKSPPLSIWVLYHLIAQSTPTRLVTYKHSSLNAIPEEIRQLQNSSSSESCNLSLTVIWRDGDRDHEMMIDPIHQGMIEGEVNIVRYLSRLLSLIDESDSVLSTQFDNWLEVVHSSIIHGNNKDRQGALKSLNSHLGKSAFLLGDSYTIADIVMWSALTQTKLHQSLPANVAKWLKSLLNVDIFQKCNDIILL